MPCSSFGAISRSSWKSVAWTVYCHWARLKVVPMLMFWTFWKKALIPGTLAVARRRRAITSFEEDLRSGFAFSWTNMRPELWLALADPAPTVDITLTTSGSAATMAATAFWRSAMAVKETSSGPWVEPVRRPVSSCGKKPLGVSR